MGDDVTNQRISHDEHQRASVHLRGRSKRDSDGAEIFNAGAAMSTVASVFIDKKDGKYRITGDFLDVEIWHQEFVTYLDALKELAKIIQREEIRYATSVSRHLDR